MTQVVIDTMPQMAFEFFFGTFPFRPTTGQTFTAPATFLESIQFRGRNDSAQPFTYRAYVYTWDAITLRPITQLFRSDPLVAPANTIYDPVIPTVPNPVLTVGGTYIAFLSTAEDPNPPNLAGVVSGAPGSAYLLGTIAENPSQNFSDLFANPSTWMVNPPFDLAFRFVFRTGAVPCLHPNTLVQCLNEIKPICEVKSGDKVIDVSNTEHEVLYNMKFAPASDFIKIEKNALGENQPVNDIFIRKGHLILFNGKPTDPRRLTKKYKGVRKCELTDAVPVWSLCTKKKTYIMMEGIPVASWSDKEIQKNTKFFYEKF
jgi:hypothetical protein